MTARRKKAARKNPKKAAKKNPKKAPKKKSGKKRATKEKAAKQARRPATSRASRGVALADIRRAAMTLPGVEEGTSYGTPAFRVKKKLFLRIHQAGDDLVVRLDDDLCEMLMATEPEIFHKTPHYEGHPYLLARLSAMTVPRLVEVIDDSWQLAAPAGLVEARIASR